MGIVPGFLALIPLALPHGLERVPRLEDFSVPRLGELVQVIRRFAIVRPDLAMTVRETGGATMVETSMEFVHSVTVRVVPIHVKRFVGNQEGLFTYIFGMLVVGALPNGAIPWRHGNEACLFLSSQSDSNAMFEGIKVGEGLEFSGEFLTSFF